MPITLYYLFGKGSFPNQKTLKEEKKYEKVTVFVFRHDDGFSAGTRCLCTGHRGTD
jgi:hypothetical protein